MCILHIDGSIEEIFNVFIPGCINSTLYRVLIDSRLELELLIPYEQFLDELIILSSYHMLRLKTCIPSRKK